MYKIVLIFFLSYSLSAMTLEEWRVYKKTDAYKQEQAEIEARKAKSRLFFESRKEFEKQKITKDAFEYKYKIKQPFIASKRYEFFINGIKASIPYETNYPIHKTNPHIKRLIIAIHSSNHDAKMYFNNTSALTKSLQKTDETLIVAPQFLITSLIQEPTEADFLFWKVPPFRGTSKALYKGKKVSLSAYEILDEMINEIVSSNNFPNFRSVVIFGHSAGGQMVNRFAAYSRFDKNTLDVRYIVMAPSSYVYFNKERVQKGTLNHFEVPQMDEKYYNYWGNGLKKLYQVHRRNRVSPDIMRKQYKNSKITYLVGSRDNDPSNSSLGKSKSSMMQGSHRVERAQVYYNYLQHYFGRGIVNRQHLYVVPNVGHSSKGLMNSEVGQNVLFLN
ncbi:hypothetical protein [Sulfurimonas sp.]|uniref:hypothetical protein n=1 Tax=Sulfurimonas sp. TaxID=2022749 RepID=UPI003D0A5905